MCPLRAWVPLLLIPSDQATYFIKCQCCSNKDTRYFYFPLQLPCNELVKDTAPILGGVYINDPGFIINDLSKDDLLEGFFSRGNLKSFKKNHKIKIPFVISRILWELQIIVGEWGGGHKLCI